MLTSDNELIQLYMSDRDEDAFEQLIRRHSPMVWGVCRSLLWQSQDAEDAYQATFILLATNAPKLLEHNSVGGWLHETSVRTCLKFRRQVTRTREVKMEYDPIQCNSEPWQIIASARDRELLHREITCLPDRYREVVVLCLLEGKSRGQAAAIIQCTTTVVKAALAQGRKLLRRRLLKHGIGMSALLGLVGSVKAANPDSVSQLLEPLIESTLQVCFLPPQLATQSLSPGIQSLVQNKLFPFSPSFSSSALVVSATVIVVGSFLSAFCWLAPQRPPEAILIEVVPSKFVEPLTTVSLEIAFPVNPPKAIRESTINPLDQEGPDYREAQITALTYELALMKEMVGLDDATIKKIETALRHELEQAVTRYLEREIERRMIFVVPVLEEEFEKAIWQKAKDFIPESKMSDYEQFVAGAKKLNVIHNKNGQKTVAHFLSKLLSLSKDQELQIKTMLGECWELEWNLPARILDGNDATKGRDIFDSLRLESVLSDEQLDVYNTIENYADFSRSSIASNPDNPAWDLLELKNRCNVLMDLRIDEIHRLCGLSPSQQKRLVIAKKGAISEVVSRWKYALHAMREEQDGDQVHRLTLQCLTCQCTSRQIWTKAIQNTLDKDELQQWEARELARTQAERDGIVDQMMSSVTRNVSLSWDQHLKLVEMFEQHIETVGIETVGMGCAAEAAQHLTRIPDQKFADVFNDTQISAVLESVRSQREWAERLKLIFKEQDN